MAHIVSDGVLRGLSRPTPPLMDRMLLTDNMSVDYLQLWKTQPAVRTTVSFLARNIAQLGVHTFRRTGDTERERLNEHPLAMTIKKPNPFTTRYRLFNSLVHDLAIYDRAYWMKSPQDGRTGLIRVPPPMVTPKGDDWLSPDTFELRGSKGTKQFPADSFVYFRGYSGDATDFGSSPLEALRQTLAEEFQSSRTREQILRNGARVSGYLKRPKTAGKWNDSARQQFALNWKAQYTGDGPATGGTPILEDDMEFVAASQTAKDLQYVEARKLTREEVAAAYFVPPPMLGILDHATFSNIEQQHKMLYQDTLGPWMTMISEEIELQLIPEIADNKDIYVEFNLAEKLRGDFKDRAAQMQTAVGAPWMTINEARAMDNKPPVEGGDILVSPLNVTQNGDQNPIPAEDNTTTDGLVPNEPKPTPDEGETED